MNDTLELCEVECGDCEGRGEVLTKYASFDFYPIACPYCYGTGKVTVHQWKRIGATSDGRSLKECQRCGEVEECG